MQNPSGFGFGAPGATQPGQTGLFGSTPSGGGLFQTAASSTTAPTLFGTTTTANPTFGSSTTPAFGATSSAAPAFGATPIATPAFGSTAGTTSAFGATPSATPSFGATSSAVPAFGATSTATPGFGVTPGAAPSFSTATGATPAFGTTTSAAPSFGSTPVATLGFGAAPTATPSFGVAPTVNPSFGATTTAAPSFNAITTTSAGFGGLQAPASGFGTAPGTGLAFGTTASSTPPAFGFGTTTSAAGAPNTSLSFNLGAALTSTPTTTATISSGLGGQPTTQTKIITAQKDVSPRDQQLPNEILQTVESFKELVKQQKLHSSEIARCSVRDFRKVEQEIQQMTNRLCEVQFELQRNIETAEKLKYDTAKCLKDVEIAQRTHDTPPGLQYENTAPLNFFLNLADKFEREMQVLKTQIASADNYVKNYQSPKVLTPVELKLGIRQLHESFVALAGRLYSVHSQVEAQKEAYMNTRKHFFHDNTNPFETLDKVTEAKLYLVDHPTPKVATGPTPFSNLALGINQPSGSQQNQSGMSYSAPTTTATGGFGNIGFGTTFGSQLPVATQPLFGSSSFNQNSNAFQLQKPPTGNKRGKQ